MKTLLLPLIAAAALLAGCMETPPAAEEVIALEAAPAPSMEEILAIE